MKRHSTILGLGGIVLVGLSPTVVDAFSTVPPSRPFLPMTTKSASPSKARLSSSSFLQMVSTTSTTTSSADTEFRRQPSNSTFTTGSIVEQRRVLRGGVSPTDAIMSSTTSLQDNEESQQEQGDSEYQRGLVTIAFITLLFSSNSPVLHAAFSTSTSSSPPPVLLLNAAVSVVALVGLLLGGSSLESQTSLPSSLEQQQGESVTMRAGIELGLWKFLGTTANLYGLAFTTASHGALLIQLTTLIVPVVQGLQGVPIPRRIQLSVGLALAGVVCFTQDPTGTPSAMGDALCVVAAIFYATYDLRLFHWGQQVSPRNLITTKIGTQAILSLGLLGMAGSAESLEFMASSSLETWFRLLPVILWSGVTVNAIAPFLQVGGQQAVGPTRCQTMYASQPLWAALLSYCFLGETIGTQGLVGGSAFLGALFLAATTSMEENGGQKKRVVMMDRLPR